MPGFGTSAYLVFDPAASPHYKVFLIPRLSGDGASDALLQLEWPPASCSLHFFSSMADRWDKRMFHRDGEAAGIAADMDRDERDHAVYWQSNLYIHRQHGYLTGISYLFSRSTFIYLTQIYVVINFFIQLFTFYRISLTNHTYRVIRLLGPMSWNRQDIQTTIWGDRSEGSIAQNVFTLLRFSFGTSTS
jgi:hypothetical protein